MIQRGPTCALMARSGIPFTSVVLTALKVNKSATFVHFGATCHAKQSLGSWTFEGHCDGEAGTHMTKEIMLFPDVPSDKEPK